MAADKKDEKKKKKKKADAGKDSAKKLSGSAKKSAAGKPASKKKAGKKKVKAPVALAETAVVEAPESSAPAGPDDAPAKAPLAVSPLAPERFPDIPPIAGVRFSTVAAGVRYQGRADVMLAEMAPGTTIAGVFTTSATRAAPVLDCQAKIGGDSSGGAAFIVNAGNANAFTGDNGRSSVEVVTTAVAEALNLPKSRVFMSSTGVIGEPLDHDKIVARIDTLAESLSLDGIEAAAQAIRTTDTFPKGAVATCMLGDTRVTIAGIAKGSGMIAPDMATMLSYVFTDATVSQPVLQRMLKSATDETFNCITVDSDTSTSDTLLLAATGKAGAPAITDARTRDAQAFKAALLEVLTNLAHQVVRDGEGATKFVTVEVTGAASTADARKVAMAVANSPLVKTAIAGEDPNWGRVVMAVGKSGAKAERDLLSIRFGDVLVAEKGWVADSYSEEQGAAVMREPEIAIGIDLGLGSRSARVWTCDLTAGYIAINADYRS